MSVWYVCPSARPRLEAEACIRTWLDFGCKIMILRQGEALCLPGIMQYPVSFYAGWGVSNNHLIRTAMQVDKWAQWFVCGGDDYWPDNSTHATTAGWDCWEHFNSSTLGVMQPTGDRYGEGYIDNAAASPWIGREFAERAYNGHGPFRDEYHHFYADTELQQVAIRLGCFWQRPDIKQEHKHWSRFGNTKPAFADELYSLYWNRDEALYKAREVTGFQGHELRKA